MVEDTLYADTFCVKNIAKRIYFSDVSFMETLAGALPSRYRKFDHNLEMVQDRR